MCSPAPATVSLQTNLTATRGYALNPRDNGSLMSSMNEHTVPPLHSSRWVKHKAETNDFHLTTNLT